MATDLSLARLRQLLQTVLTCCEAASSSVDSILASLWEPKALQEWWKDNREATSHAIRKANEANLALANAAILCDHNSLAGDGEHFRHARAALVQSLTDISNFRRSADKQTLCDCDELTKLWVELSYSLVTTERVTRNLLESVQSGELNPPAEVGESTKRGVTESTPHVKRATKHGNKRPTIIATLTAHHMYENGSCLY